MKTYHGSCHCGAVRFEADINLAEGTLRCNCSFCLKRRCWATVVKPESFRLLAGESDLTEYQFGAKCERHLLCKHCGIRCFGIGNSPRRGKFYGVSVTCLDDVSVDELANAQVTFVDSRSDEWHIPPLETRYL